MTQDGISNALTDANAPATTRARTSTARRDTRRTRASNPPSTATRPPNLTTLAEPNYPEAPTVDHFAVVCRVLAGETVVLKCMSWGEGDSELARERRPAFVFSPHVNVSAIRRAAVRVRLRTHQRLHEACTVRKRSGSPGRAGCAASPSRSSRTRDHRAPPPSQPPLSRPLHQGAIRRRNSRHRARTPRVEALLLPSARTVEARLSLLASVSGCSSPSTRSNAASTSSCSLRPAARSPCALSVKARLFLLASVSGCSAPNNRSRAATTSSCSLRA